MRGLGRLHGPRGPPCGCGRHHGALQRPAGHGVGARPPPPPAHAGSGTGIEGGGLGRSPDGAARYARQRQGPGRTLPAVDRHRRHMPAPRVRAVYKQPPERRGPSPEVWKTLAEHYELQSLFAGFVDGGAIGNVGLRVWGTKLANPTMVAHIAALLGAPAPTKTTFVRVRGFPAQLGLVADEYAQLRRYAKEAFGWEVTMGVYHCTQLAHSTLDRPVFDLELEGVPED